MKTKPTQSSTSSSSKMTAGQGPKTAKVNLPTEMERLGQSRIRPTSLDPTSSLKSKDISERDRMMPFH